MQGNVKNNPKLTVRNILLLAFFGLKNSKNVLGSTKKTFLESSSKSLYCLYSLTKFEIFIGFV